MVPVLLMGKQEGSKGSILRRSSEGLNRKMKTDSENPRCIICDHYRDEHEDVGCLHIYDDPEQATNCFCPQFEEDFSAIVVN